MRTKKRNARKNPLSKAQTRLLKESLKLLLGNGLIQNESEEKSPQLKALMLRSALNGMILE